MTDAESPNMGENADIRDRLSALRAELCRIGRLVVAFSGGADSAFLAWVATDTLGTDAVRCVTAVSPSLAPDEREDCRELAREWGLDHHEVTTHELSDPEYVANDGSRCAHCKSALMDAVAAIDADASPGGAKETPGAGDRTVVLGVNLDDLGDHRPGQQAAAERGALFPLVATGFTKADVRAASRLLGLRTWDKPAAACLASRVPYGTPVTVGTLRSVARAESDLHALGFRRLRVRHYGDTARIEVPVEDLEAVIAHRQAVADAVHRAGYQYVTLDLDGLRSGNLNQALGYEPIASGVPG
jgi:pyridinium-3,5-biscarboxylic acid mononucleotide sulfurtransferase